MKTYKATIVFTCADDTDHGQAVGLACQEITDFSPEVKLISEKVEEIEATV